MPTVLHTADWHLGKSLQRFDLIAEQREALERLLDVIDAEAPDLVVIAGDVFDVPDRQPLGAIRTWTWITEEITARTAAGLPIVVVPGNHDHPERLGYNSHLTRGSGLFVLNDLDRAHEPLEIAGVELFGIPFHKPARVRAMLQRDGVDKTIDGVDDDIDDFDYDTAMARVVQRCLAASRGTLPRLAVAHAFVAGAGDEDRSEDPVMVGGAGGVRPSTFAGFDYVALGHLHTARGLPGHAHVRYAGSLYPYSFDERGVKSVTIVRWDAGAGAGTTPEIRSVPLEVQRQVRVIDDLSFDALLALGEGMRSAGDPRRDDYLLASVSDRAPIAHAQARLNEVFPNATFEQRRIDVASDETFDVPDPNEHSLEEVFEAFYRHVYGAESTLDERELATLREALSRLQGPA